MSAGEPSEEEIRAAYEAEIKRLRVDHVLLDTVVTLVNLGMRRTGLVSGSESERDPEQVRLAIEAVRALMALLEDAAPEQVAPIRQALSQLQLAYVRIGGAPAAQERAPDPGAAEEPGAAGSRGAAPEAPAAPAPGEPGPAQRSGRLWVPGQ
jgi:hypothetical protein